MELHRLTYPFPSKVEALASGRILQAAVPTIEGVVAVSHSLTMVVQPRGVGKVKKIMARAGFEEPREEVVNIGG